ncbi:MAG: low-specificity L-threonine aldolase [Anaerolineaceae bacterium]|jgi:threonine aldolase|nr:low-specificity L-threonine aldolase [Anaerolineaceae bacterium]
MMTFIDLRSDTVTKPTPAMWAAMAKAEVGDDVYGEDPTINRLQEMAAEMLGQEAGLFVASGTMGNLIAVLAHCGRGDEVIMGDKAHTFIYEVGGVAALGGVHTHTIPNQEDGTLRIEDIRAAIRGRNVHFPITKLVVLENTQNRCGGIALPVEYCRQVAELAHEHGLALHLDGARIFNAAVYWGVPVKELTGMADSVTFCLSKALCAPVGSVLCGSKDFIARALRIRKQLGGGMRQAGVLAAAGIVALDEMVDRLAEDHQRAKALAAGLAKISGLAVQKKEHETNMVFVRLMDEVSMSDAEVVAALKAEGILASAAGPRLLRLVTHYWIDDAAVEKTIRAFEKVLG